MATAYFLKMRTTKKACHRTSFQTARVRRMVRRNIAENLLRIRGTHTFRAILLITRRYFHATSEARQKNTGNFSPIYFALYHIGAALSKEMRTYVCKFLREILLTCLYLSYLLQYNKREERYGCESTLASDFSSILLKYS